MSVKPATHRGKPVWRVQVIRDGGAFNRRRFLDRRPRAEQLASAASGAAIASEAWSVATVAIADLEAARSEAMVTLAELDALHAAHRVEHHSDDTADGTAILAARQQVLALVGDEDAVLATLRGKVRD